MPTWAELNKAAGAAIAPTKTPAPNTWAALNAAAIKPAVNKFGSDVSTHIMNPLNPRSELYNETGFPKVNILKETFNPKNLATAAKKSVVDLARSLAKPFVETGVMAVNEARNIKSAAGLVLDVAQGERKFSDPIPEGRDFSARTYNVPGYGESGPLLTGDESAKTTAKKVVGTALELGTWFVGIPQAKTAVNTLRVLGSKPIQQMTVADTKAFVSAYAKKVLGSSLVLGPMFGAGTSLQEDAGIKDTFKNILKSTATIAAMEVALTPIFARVLKGKPVGNIEKAMDREVTKEFSAAKKAETAKVKENSTFPKESPLPKDVQAEVSKNVLKQAENTKTIETPAKVPKAPKTAKPETKIEIKDELSSKKPQKAVNLVQEARKYTTAKDFVKSRPTYYHGTNAAEAIQKKGFTVSKKAQKGSSFLGDNFVEGVHLSTSRKPYKPGGQLENVSAVLETKINAKNILKTDFAGIGKLYEKYGINANSPKASQKLTTALKKKGYDGISYADEIVIFDPKKVMTKDQMVKTWDRAQKAPKTRVIAEKPTIVDTPEIRTSKLASGVEAKAIKERLTEGFEGKPEYAKVNVAKQADAATKLLDSNPDKAYNIAMGRELPPEGLLPESVFTAVENRALKTGDVATLRDLATSSSLSSEATAMGQRIRMLAERNPDSAVAKIQEVVKAREDAALRRTKSKDLTQAKKKVSEQIKKEISKTNTKQSWASFVESIKC